MSKLKLTIELVPSSSWQNNLRGILKPKMWKEIRKKVNKKDNERCSVCNSKGRLHAHEVWEYNDQSKIQTLKNIISLCYYCHGVKHFGYTTLKNSENKEKFVKHFMKVNKCDRLTFQKHLIDETGKFNERSEYEWQLDLTKLKDFE